MSHFTLGSIIFCVEHSQVQELSNIQATGDMCFPCDPMAMAGSPFSSSFSNGSNGSNGQVDSRHDSHDIWILWFMPGHHK